MDWKINSIKKRIKKQTNNQKIRIIFDIKIKC